MYVLVLNDHIIGNNSRVLRESPTKGGVKALKLLSFFQQLGRAFIWLGVLFVLTVPDYLTRYPQIY